MAVMFCSTTETDVDPVQAEQPPDDAVIVDDPCDNAVTKPPCETDTAVGSLEDQATPDDNAFWLPSL
jgi:hypothetical protein